jgi:hypothetical protein
MNHLLENRMDWETGTYHNPQAGDAQAEVIICSDWAPIRGFKDIILQDPEAVYGDLLPELRGGDMRIVNLECPLVDNGGTVTTIDSQVHHDHLIQRGIQPGPIISQPCDQLATEIEKGPAGKTVSQMIETYMQQAARNIDPGSGKIYAALCCTHFGYCRELIRDTLADLVEKPVTILNPNRQMAAYMFANRRAKRFSDTTVEIQVVSKITWEKRKIKSISSLIQSISGETSNALINYAHIPKLFR